MPGVRQGRYARLYLRSGIGLDRPGEAIFTDTDWSSTVPAALYG
ncbi:MAG: hypothetical protein OXI20_17250 [Rhodospirillales bacterium]|nr:hypothetical protein [Rhodospirillales bacterium]